MLIWKTYNDILILYSISLLDSFSHLHEFGCTHDSSSWWHKFIGLGVTIHFSSIFSWHRAIFFFLTFILFLSVKYHRNYAFQYPIYPLSSVYHLFPQVIAIKNTPRVIWMYSEINTARRTGQIKKATLYQITEEFKTFWCTPTVYYKH